DGRCRSPTVGAPTPLQPRSRRPRPAPLARCGPTGGTPLASATTAPAAQMPPAAYTYRLPFVIAASAAGTVIEWYDFYLYGVLAAFFATQFFPPGNDVAALLSSLATFGAGFAVRPFGAAVFGRIGDITGRKFTFMLTILI